MKKKQINLRLQPRYHELLSELQEMYKLKGLFLSKADIVERALDEFEKTMKSEEKDWMDPYVKNNMQEKREPEIHAMYLKDGTFLYGSGEVERGYLIQGNVYLVATPVSLLTTQDLDKVRMLIEGKQVSEAEAIIHDYFKDYFPDERGDFFVQHCSNPFFLKHEWNEDQFLLMPPRLGYPPVEVGKAIQPRFYIETETGWIQPEKLGYEIVKFERESSVWGDDEKREYVLPLLDGRFLKINSKNRTYTMYYTLPETTEEVVYSNENPKRWDLLVYSKLQWISNVDFIESVEKFLEKGYTLENITRILTGGHAEVRAMLLKNDTVKKVTLEQHFTPGGVTERRLIMD